MPLSSGTRLGPYEIGEPIGAGGMGEVYRAKDTRLDRTVAIKVLPAHLAANAESRQRFEREATSSSLAVKKMIGRFLFRSVASQRGCGPSGRTSGRALRRSV